MQQKHQKKRTSPSMRREWIEMVVVTCVITVISMSPSMRREWIEISNEHDLHQTANSLPPCGGSGLKYLSGYLRGRRQQSPSMRREWIEMPVEYTKYIKAALSPSMRREWIEMSRCLRRLPPACPSPSMRREWIEMFFTGQNKCFPQLSPSMRREWIEIFWVIVAQEKAPGLPPCGGSGLKFQILRRLEMPLSSLPPCGGSGLK